MTKSLLTYGKYYASPPANLERCAPGETWYWLDRLRDVVREQLERQGALLLIGPEQFLELPLRSTILADGAVERFYVFPVLRVVEVRS